MANRIAIILSVYNGENYLKEQLTSLFENTCQDWDLYVSDDGSTDQTEQIVMDYAKNYPGRVRYRRNPDNLRSAANFYCGLQWAYEQETTQYFMFCDQDDRWDADKISVTLSCMEQAEARRKEAGAFEACACDRIPVMVYTDSRMTDETGNVLHPSFQRASHFDSEQCDLAHLLTENKMPGCTQMCNRALVQKAFMHGSDLPEHMKMHDWWFGLVGAAFGKVIYLDRTTMDYRQHAGNVVGGTGFVQYVLERLRGIGRIRTALREGIDQGICFRNRFGDDLSIEQKQVLDAYCELRSAGFFRKRRILMQYPFRKSGLVRNIALFLFL